MPTITMVDIPAGEFLMGNSGVDDDDLYGNHQYTKRSEEYVQHTVNLSSYRIGKYQVTRGEYREFVEDADGYNTESYWTAGGYGNYGTEPGYWDAEVNSGYPNYTIVQQAESSPVIGVSWLEAAAFCNYVGGRLPTEAQWEKAARWDEENSHPNIYPWGDAWDASKCWCQATNRFLTTSVGSYSAGASPYGCMDMAGNVWEWVRDIYENHYDAGSVTDPQGPTTGSNVVIRGGAWWSGNTAGDDYRTARRRSEFLTRSNDKGFRVVMDALLPPADLGSLDYSLRQRILARMSILSGVFQLGISDDYGHTFRTFELADTDIYTKPAMAVDQTSNNIAYWCACLVESETPDLFDLVLLASNGGSNYMPKLLVEAVSDFAPQIAYNQLRRRISITYAKDGSTYVTQSDDGGNSFNTPIAILDTEVIAPITNLSDHNYLAITYIDADGALQFLKSGNGGKDWGN